MSKKKYVQIISTPPGRAPLNIREAWLGMDLPLAEDAELHADPPQETGMGAENIEGYVVVREEAVMALVQAGKDEASYFWGTTFGKYLLFSRRACRPYEKEEKDG